MLLGRLGLKTVGALAAIPRAALERRFRSREAAQSVQLRLDQMTGAVREPLIPLHPPEPCRAFLAMNEPVIDVSGVQFALDELLVRLSHRLEKGGEGARSFRLTAFRADGGSSSARACGCRGRGAPSGRSPGSLPSGWRRSTAASASTASCLRPAIWSAFRSSSRR